MDTEISMVLDCTQCKIMQPLREGAEGFQMARRMGWSVPYDGRPPYICPECRKKYLASLKNNI